MKNNKYNFFIDSESQVVIKDGVHYKISRSESNIIEHFRINNKGLTKTELTKIGWPNKIVSENSVCVALSNIRKLFKTIFPKSKNGLIVRRTDIKGTSYYNVDDDFKILNTKKNKIEPINHFSLSKISTYFVVILTTFCFFVLLKII
ncbi:winged helix-turn-helix domain-containing protein [Vibrio sonorensis]|uniref:winged helix-turn-helix domain-containing protein n=1 Tax=Vibrio sonorensis TaxID=1004316 RepID=UPI0008D90D82|nr:hypothetical protein [Vibrio sonorensis]